MLAASLGLMIFTDPAAAVNAMITGAHSAVELSLNLLALYAFWLGFFSLIEKLGLSRVLEKLLRPVISRLFPNSNAETRKYITMNVSANLLGLGNAATPMAINAIKLMDDGSKKASTDMIMLTVISATSLQILPTTVIGMRATAGSANPADFLFPSLIATVLSTFIGIVGVKLCSKIFDRKKKQKTNTNVNKENARVKLCSKIFDRKKKVKTDSDVNKRNAKPKMRLKPFNGKKSADGVTAPDQKPAHAAISTATASVKDQNAKTRADKRKDKRKKLGVKSRAEQRV